MLNNRYTRIGVLIGAVVLSAWAVVYAKHQGRKLFIELQTLQKSRDDMAVEWGQLQLEQSTLVTHGRIENTAHARLGMILPPADAMVMVKVRP